MSEQTLAQTHQHAEAIPPAAPPERRRDARSRYRVLAAARYVVRPHFRCDEALVKDLSASGAGLLLVCAPEPGAVLLVRLPGGPAEEGPTRLARVTHVRPLPEGDYFVGCRFARPLSEEELAGLRQHLGPGERPRGPV
jgi:hypothetical protein